MRSVDPRRANPRAKRRSFQDRSPAYRSANHRRQRARQRPVSTLTKLARVSQSEVNAINTRSDAAPSNDIRTERSSDRVSKNVVSSSRCGNGGAALCAGIASVLGSPCKLSPAATGIRSSAPATPKSTRAISAANPGSSRSASTTLCRYSTSRSDAISSACCPSYCRFNSRYVRSRGARKTIEKIAADIPRQNQNANAGRGRKPSEGEGAEGRA